MYTIYADGTLIYDLSRQSQDFYLLAPDVEDEINKSGSCSFTILPTHPYYNNFRQMQTTIQVIRDGIEEVFGGRVLTITDNLSKQRQIKCEGYLSYLLDSQVPPFEEEERTIAQHLQWIIAQHNSQVESYKQFQIGTISATKASTVKSFENTTYTDSRSMIETDITNVYGGIIRARRENGILYLDWIESYGTTSTQTIKMGENLIDFSHDTATTDLYTVLLPIGDEGLTIESVTGSKYIRNNTLVNKYGIIIKSASYETDDAQELYSKAVEDFNKYTASLEDSYSFTVLDLHLLNPNIRSFKLGDAVRIEVPSHGYDFVKVCTKRELHLDKPESDKYTFGVPDPTSMSKRHASVSRTATEASKTAQKAVVQGKKNEKDLIRTWDQVEINANDIRVNANNISINASEHLSLKTTYDADKAGYQQWKNNTEIWMDSASSQIGLIATHTEQIASVGQRMTSAEISIDGLESEIALKASNQVVHDMIDEYDLKFGETYNRLTQAEININGNTANINLKASQAEFTELAGVVDENTERISDAEIDIDGIHSTILLKADKIELQGYVTIDSLRNRVLNVIGGATIPGILADGIVVNNQLSAANVSAGTLNANTGFNFLNHSMALQTFTIVNSFTQALGESSPTTTITLLVSSYEQPNHWAVHMGETITF